MEVAPEPVLAHVLFMDIVGCSKLPTDEQRRIGERLQEVVRASDEFRRAEQNDQVICLPTGDGMALAFLSKLDAAVVSAIEITQAIQAESLCRIRMGVHTGPVFVVSDINHNRNISGAGINRAERVMSSGEDRHILLSDNVAESLQQLSQWQGKIHRIGECRVKDGWVRVWNLVDGPIGNPAFPKKSRKYLKRRRMLITAGEAVLALAVLATVAGAFWAGRTGKGPIANPDQASIAVLPFTDMSPEKNQEYFSDGLAEEMLNGLAKIPGLRVSGRSSSFKFKGHADDPKAIGEKLRVATILEGSVRKQGSRAKVAVQLIKAEDGFGMWSEIFDRDMNDIFAVQEEIARAVTGALKVKLLGNQNVTAPAKSSNIDAYNAYLQGRFFMEQDNRESLLKAVDYFEKAIALDGAYASAWVGLSHTRSSQAAESYIPLEEGYKKAREAVERALALNAGLGDAWAALGWIMMLHDWDWPGADAAYQKAMALEPGNAKAIRGAAAMAMLLGRSDDAIPLNRRSVAVNPLGAGDHYNLGVALHYGGRQDEARAAFQKAVELAPQMTFAHTLLGRVHLAQSKPREALAEMEQEKEPYFRLYGMALAYHALGRKKESDDSLAELIAKFQEDDPYQIALVYAFRGETDRAIEWLERAYTHRDPGLSEMKADPLLKGLRRDPRYTALLKKLRLA